jgi:hypothetical protein
MYDPSRKTRFGHGLRRSLDRPFVGVAQLPPDPHVMQAARGQSRCVSAYPLPARPSTTSPPTLTCGRYRYAWSSATGSTRACPGLERDQRVGARRTRAGPPRGAWWWWWWCFAAALLAVALTPSPPTCASWALRLTASRRSSHVRDRFHSSDDPIGAERARLGPAIRRCQSRTRIGATNGALGSDVSLVVSGPNVSSAAKVAAQWVLGWHFDDADV